MVRAQVAMPIVVTIILTALLVPLPPIFLDLLISTNISLSVVVLLAALYVLKPVEFSAFPSILLLTTLFRLSLNIASTRLILLNGGEGVGAAGNVIGAFGQFVVGGNYVVGLIIFLVLIIIQYVVINHGAVRISEVTARFTLDALPGKQLSIDADLNAGIIDQDEARTRRETVGREADFYGSMDGAIRFTQRDAMASILITLINIVGGLFIGMFQNGMDAFVALETFTILTIGDGLVTDDSLAPDLRSVVVSLRPAPPRKRVWARTSPGSCLIRPEAGVLFSCVHRGRSGIWYRACRPWGFSYLEPFSVGSHSSSLERRKAALGGRARRSKRSPPEDGTVERATAFLKIDSLAVEIGYGLVGLVDAQVGGDFLSRIRSIRKQLAQELGMIVPPVNISDNLKLGPREYSILLKGSEIGRGELMMDRLLAIDPGSTTGTIEGTPTKEPTFGLPAFWITKENKERSATDELHGRGRFHNLGDPPDRDDPDACPRAIGPSGSEDPD